MNFFIIYLINRNLSENQLSGKIPDSINSLVNLDELYIFDNYIIIFLIIFLLKFWSTNNYINIE